MSIRFLVASVLASVAALAALLASLSDAVEVPEDMVVQYDAAIGACADGPNSGLSGCVYDVLNRYSGLLPRGLALASGIDMAKSRVGPERDCHSVLHSFGEAAGAVYGKRSIVPAAGDCEFAYYHGATIGIGDPEEAAEGCAFLEVVVESAGCWHGVGHAFWLSGAGIEGSLAGCMKGAHVFQQESCMLGAVMEYSMLMGPEAFDMCLSVRGLLPPEQYGRCVLTVATHGAIGYGESTFARCVSLPAGPHPASECRFHVGIGLGTQIRGLSDVEDVIRRVPGFCLQDVDCAAGVARGLSVIEYEEGFVQSYCTAAGVVGRVPC